MGFRGYSRRTLNLGLVVFLLSGCGQGANAPLPQSAAQSPVNRASGSEHQYLYVAERNETKGTLETKVLSLPDGKKVGTIANFGKMCEDASGNVYITTETTVTEYPPGSTTAAQQLTLPYQVYAIDCAINPVNGKLAVCGALRPNTSTYLSWLGIYSNFQRKPKTYSNDAMDNFVWCGYDGSGNLFLSGYEQINHYAATGAELPKNSKTFIQLNSFYFYEYLGPIQWDGHYITIEGSGRSGGKVVTVIYQLTVSVSSVNLAGEVFLDKHHGTSWIQGNMVAKVDRHDGFAVGLWHYPQGGPKPYAIFTGHHFLFYPLIDVSYSK